MRRVFSLSLLALFCALSARAQSSPSFESVVAQASGEFLQARADAKDAALARDIERSARDAEQLNMDIWRLRSQVSDVRRRAQQASNNQNQPHDPFLRNEVQRLVWDLRDYARKLQDLHWDIQRLARSAQQKDPELVQPAQRLSSALQRLSSELTWVVSDARWASMDVRRAGFSMEAWDIERESSAAENSARQAQYEAQRLLGQVR